VLIARTDARAVEGLDAALGRARAYRDAGADVLFVEAPENEDEIEAIAAAFPDTPLVFNSVDGGRTPQLPLDRLQELGFGIVLRPVATLFAAARAVQEMLRTDSTTMAFDEFTDLIGLPELQALEDRLTDPGAQSS
jgi:2-methylisocitrate lyase-like PEP mutase family enzyme